MIFTMSKKCEKCRKIFKAGDYCLYCGGKLTEYISPQEPKVSNSNSGPVTGSNIVIKINIADYFAKLKKLFTKFKSSKKALAILSSIIVIIISITACYFIFHKDIVTANANDMYPLATDGGLFYSILGANLTGETLTVDLQVKNMNDLSVTKPGNYFDYIKVEDMKTHSYYIENHSSSGIYAAQVTQKAITMNQYTPITYSLKFTVPSDLTTFWIYVPDFGYRQNIDYPKKLYALEYSFLYN